MSRMRRTGSAVLGVVVLGAAVIGARGQRLQECRLPPPPPRLGRDVYAPGLGVDSLREYAKKLTYLAGHPFGEERRLTIKRPDGTFALGPFARAHPFECAHRFSSNALDSGRVVARIILPATEAYEKLGLPPGVSFVYIDSVNAAAGTARALIIPLNPLFPAERRSVKVESQSTPRSFPEARWIFDPEDDHLWVSCYSLGCCRVTHDEE